MQSSTIILVAILACVFADIYVPLSYAERYSMHEEPHKTRYARDLNWQRNIGRGTVFGTLGGTDDSLFGRGGYKQDIFNDHRGRLEGQAYGSRVLGANGDSSSLGGQLNWSNDNARLGADLQREIGGRTGLTVTGEGSWKLDHNTRLNAGGNVHKTFGHDRPELGLQAEIVRDF